MSGAMNEAMEAWEQGFDSSSDKNVCSRHFDDYGVKAFITSHQQSEPCSFCKSKKSVPLGEVVKHLFNSFRKFYSKVEDGGVPWDEEESAWAGEYPDSKELIFHEIGLSVEPYELQEAIEMMCFDDLWVWHNAFTLTDDDYLMDSWDFFARILKEQMRYVFFKATVERYDPIGMVSGPSDPSTILNDIGKHIDGLKLYTKYKKPKPLQLYRARQHSVSEKITHCKQLGAPPSVKAMANRFSAAGISMFYGAEDRDTAILELKVNGVTGVNITSGKFTIKENIQLIDLTNLPKISIFDSKRNDYYETIEFLKRFIDSISKPLLPFHSEHIEYVPTQVVTEYFRHIFPDQFDKRIDGIKYRSAINGKLCYVLFFEQRHSSQDDEEENKFCPICLEMKSIKTTRHTKKK